jgi:3'(2'), 5'-bisphosphate nucleotidase
VVEPVGGTKKFLRANGEYTVNITLMDFDAPNFGIVYASVIDKLYYDARGPVAHKIDRKLTTEVKAPRAENSTLLTVANRPHQSQEESLERFIRGAEKREFLVMVNGSALKFFPVAEEHADTYPTSAEQWAQTQLPPNAFLRKLWACCRLGLQFREVQQARARKLRHPS